jgi:subtilisin family serine protease
MKVRFATLAMIAVVLLGCSNPFGSGSAPEVAGVERVEGQLIVSFEDRGIDTEAAVAKAIPGAKGAGFSIVNAITDLAMSKGGDSFEPAFKARIVEKMGHVYTYAYSTSEYKTFDAAAEALRAMLEGQGLTVRYVEPNLVYRAIGDVSAQAVHPSQQWHYDMIKAPEAWTLTTGSPNTLIAVLDTGVDYNHQSLKNFINTSLAKSYTGSTYMDGHGHGTHCIGTVASYGSVSGVMQVASIIPVKVLSDSGSGTTDNITAAILYAASVNADVISMSLGGGGYDTTMANACATAVAEGTIVVAATGNDGKGTVSYPGAYPNVIGVGSVTSSRARASYSNYGNGLDVMAPGSNIYSCKPGNQYTTMSGTSMATPHVAGVLGLMRAADPELSVADATSILFETCQYAGSATYYGNGIVDAHAAVTAVLGGGGDVYRTKTALTTDAATYVAGSTIYITATITDQHDAALPGASVAFKVTAPNGTATNGTATSDANGFATFAYATTTASAAGTYAIAATTTMNGYESSSANASVTVTQAGNPGIGVVVTTDKASYARGAYVYITATVRRTDTNALLSGASVKFILTKPNGTTMTTTVTTGSSGTAKWTLRSGSGTAIGTYTVGATATKSGFTAGTGSTAFSIY